MGDMTAGFSYIKGHCAHTHSETESDLFCDSVWLSQWVLTSNKTSRFCGGTRLLLCERAMKTLPCSTNGFLLALFSWQDCVDRKRHSLWLGNLSPPKLAAAAVVPSGARYITFDEHSRCKWGRGSISGVLEMLSHCNSGFDLIWLQKINKKTRIRKENKKSWRPSFTLEATVVLLQKWVDTLLLWCCSIWVRKTCPY